MATHEGASSKECYILCFNSLGKGTDRNPVNGKNKVVEDLKDLPLVVHNLMEYICKRCLTLIKKRTSLKEKLKGVDRCLTVLHVKKCGRSNLTIKRKCSEDIEVLTSEDYVSR